jgi:hypothetical protein
LGRGTSRWAYDGRNMDKYVDQFWNMINDGFPYPLVVYTNSTMREKILERKCLPDTIFLLDLKNVETFLTEPYLSREAEIMASVDYMEKIPLRRKPAPEHTNPEYTLLTHSKISFVNHSHKLFPRFMYYAWIDFGYIKGAHPCG